MGIFHPENFDFYFEKNFEEKNSKFLKKFESWNGKPSINIRLESKMTKIKFFLTTYHHFLTFKPHVNHFFAIFNIQITLGII